MSKESVQRGIAGEEAAVEFLKERGYSLVCRNYRTKVGEVDIIAREHDTYCFIEVKTRESVRFGMPCEAITQSKQRRISKAALFFLKENKLLGAKARFDVATVDGTRAPKIELIKNAFELDGRFSY